MEEKDDLEMQASKEGVPAFLETLQEEQVHKAVAKARRQKRGY